MSKPFVPTDAQREIVECLAAFGIPHPHIARELAIGEDMLRKHFRDQLDLGLSRANAKVAQTLFNQAVRGDCIAATIFWLKTRARWRETERVEHTGPEGGPLQFVIYGEREAKDAAAWQRDHAPK